MSVSSLSSTSTRSDPPGARRPTGHVVAVICRKREGLGQCITKKLYASTIYSTCIARDEQVLPSAEFVMSDAGIPATG